jgi:transposase
LEKVLPPSKIVFCKNRRKKAMANISIRLSKNQKKHLKKIYKREKSRVSQRAHMVLLYDQGYSMEEIAIICQCDRGTVSTQLKNFKEHREKGLYDKKRCGAPRILNDEDQEYLFCSLEESPKDFGYFATVWTIEIMLDLLKRRRSKDISPSALKKILKKQKWKWNRPKQVPPNAEPIRETEKQEIIRLLKNPREDEIILFEDEMDLELLPRISGAWMPEGKQLEIETPGQNKITCIFGFFNPHNKNFLMVTD